MRVYLLASVLTIATGCASSKPPSISDSPSKRIPINTAPIAIVIGSGKIDRSTAPATTETVELPVFTPETSRVFVFHFEYGSSTFTPGMDELVALLPLAKSGSKIVVRGRTDALRPSAGDETIAKDRAISARNLLVAKGISPEKIYLNYVSASDHVSDITTADGRARNRRVEIEVFN